jgi:hypothetical protein
MKWCGWLALVCAACLSLGAAQAADERPLVSFSEPAAGAQVSGDVLLKIDFASNSAYPVQGLEVFVDGVRTAAGGRLPEPKMAGSEIYYWDSRVVPNGRHDLGARAGDGGGNQGTATIMVRVANAEGQDLTPPTVSILAPEPEAVVRGTVEFTVEARDDSGVSWVNCYVDGQLWAARNYPPFTESLDTTVLSEGPHTLRAAAYDRHDNFATSPTINIFVNNSGAALIAPGSGPTPPAAAGAEPLIIKVIPAPPPTEAATPPSEAGGPSAPAGTAAVTPPPVETTPATTAPPSETTAGRAKSDLLPGAMVGAPGVEAREAPSGPERRSALSPVSPLAAGRAAAKPQPIVEVAGASRRAPEVPAAVSPPAEPTTTPAAAAGAPASAPPTATEPATPARPEPVAAAPSAAPEGTHLSPVALFGGPRRLPGESAIAPAVELPPTPKREAAGAAPPVKAVVTAPAPSAAPTEVVAPVAPIAAPSEAAAAPEAPVVAEQGPAAAEVTPAPLTTALLAVDLLEGGSDGAALSVSPVLEAPPAPAAAPSQPAEPALAPTPGPEAKSAAAEPPAPSALTPLITKLRPLFPAQRGPLPLPGPKPIVTVPTQADILQARPRAALAGYAITGPLADGVAIGEAEARTLPNILGGSD